MRVIKSAIANRRLTTHTQNHASVIGKKQVNILLNFPFDIANMIATSRAFYEKLTFKVIEDNQGTTEVG